MADKQQWLFAVKVHDKPGTLTAVSSVFSNRGVSIEMLLGSTLHAVSADAIDLYFVCRASEPRRKELHRTLGRLASVISVECHSCDSPKLRAVVFAHVDPRAMPADTSLAEIATAESVAFSPVICDDDHETWILMAGPASVDRCVEKLRATGALLDTTVTIIPVE